MRHFLQISLALAMLISCSGKNSGNSEGNSTKADFVAEKNLVDTMVLVKKDFNKQIISNGKLRAVNKCELKFFTSGEIEKIFVSNGMTVTKGQVIAKLNTQSASIRLEQASQRMDKAELDFADILIGFGYGKDTANIPKDILKVAKVRSGYISSINDLKLAKLELNNANLRAPFSGKIANLKAKEYEQSSGAICTLIDDSAFEVDFNLLESEISFVKVGQTVKVASFVNPDTFYRGVVTQINPMVDDKGQINILAKVSNSGGKLLEGMNVKVLVENLIKNQLVVPKSAVVMRDNFEVLFRYDGKGMAMWTYVNVVFSNSDSHVVAANPEKNAELNVNDVIITSGNLNLADGSNVEIRKR
ncbi:MAG: efflux RND transporter periplasmic adaptor subunit [Bacteroidales bacterium]